MGYWDDRAAARQAVYDRAAAQAVAATKKAMLRALDTLNKEMDAILRAYMRRHRLTREEAKALLESPAPADTLDGIRAKITAVKDPDLKRRLQARLESNAYGARLTRAEAMKESIRADVGQVADVKLAAGNTAIQTSLFDAQNRLMYDIQKNIGRMFSYAQMPVSRAQEVLSQRWLGGNYSSRVWADVGRLADELQTAVMENMLAGKTSDETYAELVRLAGGDVMKTNRLIRTETSYAANQGEKYAYEAAGFDDYVFVSALEMRTCKVCGGLDGKRIPLRDARPGKNYPPMHPFCRCTTKPYDPDMAALMGDGDTRWARDPVTGEVVRVPMSMTYSEWMEKQRELYGSDSVETARKKLMNRSADRKQLAAYQKVIGKNQFTSDMDAFQKMKYDSSDTYQLVKLDYKRQSMLLKSRSLALPNAAQATAADAKFTGYLFNPENKEGWAKGVAFTSRLGYNKDNWPQLQNEILAGAKKYPAKANGQIVKNGFFLGARYEQRVILYGKAGRPANVLVGWTKDSNGTHMTTAHLEEVKADAKD